MLRLFKKIALLVVLCILSLGTLYGCLEKIGRTATGFAKEVYFTIKKADNTYICDTVILGDSVCHQLWAPENQTKEELSEVCYLGNNQAITPAGSYLLLKKYLENNQQTRKVYYIILPGSLANDISLDYSYQYFVVPFCDEENMSYLEDETVDKIINTFGEFFVNNKIIKSWLINNNSLMSLYLERIQKKEETSVSGRISRTAAIYLKKMQELCDVCGAEFIVKSAPLADTSENYEFSEFKQDIVEYDLDGILDGYIEGIQYYPDNFFRDGKHFTSEALRKYGDEIRLSVLN
jgi:hypothetical protein